ncbi:retinol dehydrogenase 12-like isoform X1 [Rhipicephalus microplus]|uniref:retinol dehydrogenase 12-like isoform X1 n=1 Tax=Rhipicephalus microplus TaxID=6941 RepID=UPI003F6A65A2
MTLPSCLASIVLMVFAMAMFLKIYSLVTVGKCRSTRDMSGKTVIITGANAGIGKETARELCRRKARVILACRDVNKARATAEEIGRDTGVRPLCMRLDLCSFASIRQFASQVVAQEERLDVLINNAGILPPPTRTETEDGFETTFQANYLGHFLLTNLLLGLLKKSSPSRIINVGSLAHWFATFDADVGFQRYRRIQVYPKAKLYVALFTMELARKLADTGITVNCVHPGIVKSELTRRAQDFYSRASSLLVDCFGKSAEDGAQTSIHLAVSKEVEGVSGKMFADCKPMFSFGNEHDAQILWDTSQKMAGLC